MPLMTFTEHAELAGSHAYLSASKGYWINYNEEKLVDVYSNEMAKRQGTRLHDFAAEAIALGVKLKGNATLASYVNDAIGFRMTPEQVLFYSRHAFGTADAISFDPDKKTLRIHDLKTGRVPAHMQQLEIYAALFCLEYRVKPHTIWTCLRIYQNDDIVELIADPDRIVHIMDKVVSSSKKLDEIEAMSL